jgi:hypothetical protein
MASVIFNRFFMALGLGLINLDTDAVRVSLVDSGYTPVKTDTWWGTADPWAHEVTGDAYTAGGMAVANTTLVQDNTNALVKYDADDCTWTTSTITAKAAVLWDSTPATKDLIACYEFTEDKSSANGNFTIQWSASGLMEFKQG